MIQKLIQILSSNKFPDIHVFQLLPSVSCGKNTWPTLESVLNNGKCPISRETPSKKDLYQI